MGAGRVTGELELFLRRPLAERLLIHCPSTLLSPSSAPRLCRAIEIGVREGGQPESSDLVHGGVRSQGLVLLVLTWTPGVCRDLLLGVPASSALVTRTGIIAFTLLPEKCGKWLKEHQNARRNASYIYKMTRTPSAHRELSAVGLFLFGVGVKPLYIIPSVPTAVKIFRITCLLIDSH